VEGLDYQHKCVGLAFGEMIKTLNETAPSNFPECDIAASAVTVFSERKRGGIEFTDAIYHDKLLAMVHGKIQTRGKWAFFQPLHWGVWCAALATMFTVPFFIFFFEYQVSGRCEPSPQFVWPAIGRSGHVHIRIACDSGASQ
jgi:hypothetical protein